MKILYIAHERRAAEVAAYGLRTIAPNVSLTWGSAPDAALDWIQDNLDTHLVIVDAGMHSQGGSAFLEHVRALGVGIPVMMIAPEHLTGLLVAVEACLNSVVSRERGDSETLAAQLSEIEEWRRQVRQRVAGRQAEHDAALARVNRICTTLQTRLLELEAAVRHADERHAVDTAAVERLSLRESALEAVLAEAAAARTSLEHRLSAAETAHQQAQQHAAVDLASAVDRCVALENELSREADARATLNERLAAAGSARQEADQKHAAELASLRTRLVEIEAQHTASLTHSASVRTALQAQLLDLEAAVRTADERHAQDTAAIERSDARETELRSALAEAVAGRATLEQRLAAAETARQHAAQQHAMEWATLTSRLAEVRAQYDASVEQTASVERQLTDTVAALEQARRDWTSEVTAAAAQLDRREAELTAALAEANAARTVVENRLAEAEAAHQQAQAAAAAALAAAAEQRETLEEQVSQERALIRSAQGAVAEAEERGRLALEASSRDIARLEGEADGLRRQLGALRTQAAALRRETNRLPGLQLQLEQSHKENRRQFERAPYGLCECTRDGAVTRVNHSLARLLGYRGTADLRRMDVVATAFENGDDLRWLLERTAQAGEAQSVETTLTTRDRRRLSVRLHAMTSEGSVVIAVEDLTRLHAVEQRLREAERLEAVGRVAAEVAITCDSLLRDVTQGGQQWLAGFESDTRFRQQGELLLGDVTRAAGYLRQFVAYGHKQIGNAQPVSVPRLLHDMRPVLKRVLGDDIILVLPKTTDRFYVDVDAEPVERILVNVANYARERMSRGGRVKIQLATRVVDRRFLASHPRVRPGGHVLITIAEIQGPTWPALPVQLHTARDADPAIAPAASHKPGIDLGPLIELIGDLGGHLWMSAEPAGNMTLQIHLPRRTGDEVADRSVFAPRLHGGRQLARWFRH